MLRMRSALHVLVCLVLAACGGGGGGGGGSNPPGASGTPDSLYKGQRQQAEITESNHAVIADSAWYGPMTFFLLAQDVITEDLPDDSIDESVAGSEGGTARIRGRIRSGTGTLTVDYSNFKEEGITLNGRETVEILTRRTGESGSVRRTFTDLSYQDVDIDVIMNGSLTRTDSTTNAFIGAHWEMSGDLLLSERTSSNQRLLASVALTRDYVSASAFQSYPILTGTARVYDNVLGYVDVSFEAPIRFVPAQIEQDMAPGGSLTASGANSSKLWVSPLSADYVTVELGTQSVAKPARSLLYRWSEAFDQPVNGPEITAIVGSDIEISDNRFGSPVTLEGRFSHSVSGAFLRPEWTLLLSPPGSHAEIVDVTSTRPEFTADVDGTYLFQLKVGDGTGASSLDYLRLDAESSGQQPDLTNVRARLLTRSRIAAPAGGEIVLDASRSFTTTGHPLRGVNWRVYDRHSLSSEEFPSSVANVFATTGRDYLAVLTGDWNDFPGRPKEVWVSTPGNVWFGPTVNLGDPPASSTQLVDIDGNGTLDIVRSSLVGQPASPASTSFILNRGGGRFERLQQTLSGGATGFGSSPPGFVDISGDARLDAVVAESDGMGLWLQTSQSPLSFGALTHLPRNLSCGVGGPQAPRTWVVIDVNGDGRKDIVSEPACSAFGLPLELYINDGSTLSGFQQAVPLVGLTNNDLVKLITGDVDGDGVDDLIGVSTSLTSQIQVYRNRSNGQFDLFSVVDAPNGLFPTGLSPAFSVALVDSDTIPDLILVENGGLRVARGKGAGVFEFLPLLTPAYPSVFGSGSWEGQPVTVADMDKDGLKDIIAATWWARQVRNGEFASPRPFTSTIGPAGVGDIDGDSRLDLVSGDGPSIALGVP